MGEKNESTESDIMPPRFEPAFKKMLKTDNELSIFDGEVKARYLSFCMECDKLNRWVEGGIDSFTRGYESFGLHLNSHDNTMSVKEWIPNAQAVYIFGDFNDWRKYEYPLQTKEFGMWTTTLPATPQGSLIKNMDRYKLVIKTKDNQEIFRVCPWANYLLPDKETKLYNAHFLHPDENKFEFKYDWLLKTRKNGLINESNKSGLRIYEAHIGIATEDYKVASYQNFIENVIPHIVELGYNAVQLMAIMEHAYYGCFGYQVTNFYATSSRYGHPNDLKRLIDELHKHGIIVLLDVVHSHASNNTEDGLNYFDGTDSCYFYSGRRGCHPLWDSRLFDYSKIEVKRFLLSNLRYYLEEYHFDGFRFDGVTSMIYRHHGINAQFSGSYFTYFGEDVLLDAIVYLKCANHFLHYFYPNIITIAEEVSGMPSLARPTNECGIGFDYRMAMALPDMWIKLLKEKSDEDWNMGYIVHNLCNRRYQEKHIAYCESHDQSLVGDKTIIFWLIDSEMYTGMSCLTPKSVKVSRGIALHKMIRLITHGLGGEGYLNFIGNEFGHPEWLDFPRPGNEYSYHYARRQWNLVKSDHLRYKFLNDFDKKLNELEKNYGWLESSKIYVSDKHEDNKIISFERNNLIWIFNFHPTKSYTDYPVGVPELVSYKILLNTDDIIFDGFGNISPDNVYIASNTPVNKRPYSIKVYIPSRVAIVLKPV